MRTIQTALNEPVDVRLSAAISRNATGRVVAVNSGNQVTTIDANMHFYDVGVTFTIPASYVTSNNLPATFSVYVSYKGVERLIETITLTVVPSPIVPVSQASLDTALAGKIDKPATKTGMLSLGVPTTGQAASSVTAWAERLPVKLPFKTKRWRLRMANWNVASNTNPVFGTTPYTFSDIYFGTPSQTFNGVTGRLTGAYASAPVKIINGGNVPTDGTDYVSPWITDPLLQFGPDMMMFGLAFTAPATGNGVGLVSHHPGFRNSAGGANATVNVASGTNYFGNTLALDKRIEYEVEGNYPVGLFVGASGTAGYNLVTGQGGGYEPVLTHEQWPGVWASRYKGIALNIGAPGARQIPFTTASNWTYTRLNGTHLNADFAVIDLGGNSILNQQSVSSTQIEVYSVVQRLREFGIKRIYLMTILPIGEASSATTLETLRTQYNTPMRANPWGLDGIIDADRILRDPLNPLQQLPGYVDTDKIHPTLAGYQTLGMAINIT